MAQWVAEYIPLKPKMDFQSERESIVRFREQPIETQVKLVEEDADYGHVICRCEMVTRREVMDAINNPLGVRTITGIKLRSRSMMGRCQGGFCSTRIVDMLADKFDTRLTEISLKGPGSNLFIETTKDLRKHEN
jgi:glycerol-3-phosphate dehydrogenase